MSLQNKENTYKPALWHNVLNKARALAYRSPLYLFTLRKRKALDISPLPDVLKHDHPQDKSLLKKGHFPFAGRTYKGLDHPWTTAQDDVAWQQWVHGFNWLDDLCDLDDPDAIVKARQYVQHWLDLHGVWTPLAWRADVIADRLIAWMMCAKRLCASADNEFVQSFYTSLSLQASHLTRSYFRDLNGYTLLRALRGQVYVGLFLPGFGTRMSKSLQRLGEELARQVLPDGGHISRSPGVLLDVLAFALEISEVCAAQQIECPPPVRLAIDRMAPMIRTLRHGDGKLALFHGATEGDADKIDRLLDRTGNHGQALSDARHSGFQRVEAGRTVILMDVATPPDITCHPYGHAAPLSLEISYGEERLLVNCGAVVGGDPAWQDALAATAAHNTLTVDDRNCLSLLHGGGIRPQPVHVDVKRFEENGQVLIDASHDAYKEALGLLHHRSLYVNKTGDDIRVEDKLIGMGGETYALSLHLHPDVHASLVQDGQAALLKMNNATGWHLRVQGGKLEMRESIYVGQPGQHRHTDQIVISGPLRGEGVTLKWRLSKIGI